MVSNPRNVGGCFNHHLVVRFESGTAAAGVLPCLSRWEVVGQRKHGASPEQARSKPSFLAGG